MNTANLPADATTLTINGFDFDPNKANDTVQFNDGAIGTVTAATASALTITFTTDPVLAGSLTAVVTSDTFTSGPQVQVATVTPVVTMNAALLLNTSSTIAINGFGFDPTAGNNSVAFNLGAAGTVTSASPTQLVVTFTTQPAAGNLTAIATTDSISSGSAVQVAAVVLVTIIPNTASLAEDATQIVINGLGFSPTNANNAISFNDGAVGQVIAASATQLTVALTTAPTTLGAMNATVIVAGVGIAGPAQVATIVPSPTVTSDTAALPINASTIVITGTGFDPNSLDDTVTFNDGAVGTVNMGATATSLTVSFSTLPSAVGNLTAVVTSFGGSSGMPVQVATVTPVVTQSAANLAANAATLTINGFGFDTNSANDTVSFSDGAVGSVTTATAAQLIVTFSTDPVLAGSLTAVVTHGWCSQRHARSSGHGHTRGDSEHREPGGQRLDHYHQRVRLRSQQGQRQRGVQ